MRHIKDENGITAWIYDEATHPQGNARPLVSPLDLNKDGVVDKRDATIAGKTLKKFYSRKQ